MSIGLSTPNQTTIYQQNILKHECIDENAFSFSKYKMEQKLLKFMLIVLISQKQTINQVKR